MVVEIDDAGWGDLLGGIVIVMRRIETDERFVKEVPLSSFQGSAFPEKRYFPEVMKSVREGVVALGVTKDEVLRVCTGYILSEVRTSLTNEGFDVKPYRIVGTTQEFAEEEFIKSLVRLGVGPFNDVKSIRSFNRFLKWVLDDLDGRERFVKTGWKSWFRLRRSKG